jgi:hypothetical protein
MRASSADFDFVYFMVFKSVHLQFIRFRHAPMTKSLASQQIAISSLFSFEERKNGTSNKNKTIIT